MSAAEIQLPNPHWLISEKKRLVPVLETNALRVLLIEDSREYAALVTKTLQNQNLCEFAVERAPLLETAIQKLDRSRFDAVLLDLTLPDADAETSIDIVCSRVSNFPVIVLTASEDTNLALLAGKAGADAFILEDRLNRKTLPRKILDLVMRHRANRPFEMSLDMETAPIELMTMLGRSIFTSELGSSCVEAAFPDELIFRDRLTHTIDQARANPRRFAVLNIKLDHLAVLANLTGRSLGEKMAETAYRCLRNRISNTDTLAQVGESSFALILDGVANTESANETVMALGACISCARLPEVSAKVDVDSIGMTASIGVAMYPDDGRDLDSLLEGAESAQHRSVRAGGSAVRFCRELDLYQDYLENTLR